MADILSYENDEEEKIEQESAGGFGKIAETSIQEMKEKAQAVEMYQNKSLAEKTASIQQEFDQLMSEMLELRKDRDPDGFYTLMQQMYGKGPDDERHSSPTKRLISLKNSTFDNKKVMSDNIVRT